MLARCLLAGDDVPQAELGAKPPVRFAADGADDQCLRIEPAPLGETRHRIRRRGRREARRVERNEQAGADEIGGNHRRDVGGELRIAAKRREGGNRDRDRLDLALRDVEFQHGIGGADCARRHREPGDGEDGADDAAEAAG